MTTTMAPSQPPSWASNSDTGHTFGTVTPPVGSRIKACGHGDIATSSVYLKGIPLVPNSSVLESKLIPIGQSLPPLPQRLVQQIKAGEFVDFGELPPAKGKQLRSSASELQFAHGSSAVAGGIPAQETNT